MIPALVAGGLVLVAAVSATSALANRRGRSAGLVTPTGSQGPPAWFAGRLAAADDLDPDRCWRIWLAGIPACSAGGFWIAGGGAATACALAWMALPFFAPSWLERRRQRRRDEAVPPVLDAVARSLRSGASLIQAIAEAAGEPSALQADLRTVVAEAERGAGVEHSLDAWAIRQPSGPLRLAAAALGMAAEMGGATARTVEGVAATVRQRLAVAGESRALTSQARISAQVIALAPLAFCAIGAATDPELARFLFVTPLGWVFLVVGALLDLAGAAWMRRLAEQ